MSELVASTQNKEIPTPLTLTHAVKLALKEDRPIMLDYWESSVDQTAFFGIKTTGEKMLVKSEDEYTSPINKIFKVDKEFIVMTENSIYIVSSSCNSKRIS